MADEEKVTCENCIHFSRGLSEKGYCSFYHRNLTDPKSICNKFEHKKDSGAVPSEVQTVDTKEYYKGKTSGALPYFIGIVCAIVMFAAISVVDIALANVVFSHPLTLIVKIGIIFAVLLLFGLFIWGILALLRDHTWVFIIYLVISVGLIMFLLLDYVNVWLSVNKFLDSAVEYLMTRL
ncbi:MAG: hypothetical protein UHL70_08250 [Acutalibacteraceae bacterium]|nr:hypothetical protein [Acutalibacteraceae bacterium]